LFSNSTLNIALGNVSSTTPSTFIGSSLAIDDSPWVSSK
jgi:hypothetical protein